MSFCVVHSNETGTNDEAAYWSAPREHSSPRVMPDVHVAPDVAVPSVAVPDAVAPDVAMSESSHIATLAEGESRVALSEDCTKEEQDILELLKQEEVEMRSMYLLVYTALKYGPDLRLSRNRVNEESTAIAAKTGDNVEIEKSE